MDRVIVYPGAIPQDTDILSTNRNAMIALGYLAEACVGTTTAANGLACTPTSPASLTVNVGRGCLFSMQTVDAISYGSLGTDTSDNLMKVGINEATTSFTITPPGTAGQSQNFLIEAQFLEQGSGSTVLSYYNAANPAAPYSGPGNSGTPQYTSIIQRVALQLKAGAAAATGTQATPGADGGWTPLYVISVNSGQTQITAANITRAAGAPFLLSQLSQLPIKITSNLTIYVSAYGNDSNSGLLPTDAFATIQAAWNTLIANYNLNGYNATISVGSGTGFAGATCSGQPQGFGGGNTISIVGAGSGSTTIGGISTEAGANVSVSGVKITDTYGLVAFQGGTVSAGNDLIFGTIANSVFAAVNGQVIVGSGFSLTGNFGYCLSTSFGGFISFNNLSPITITITTPATFTAFANASSGQIALNHATVSFSLTGGAVTGRTYNASLGGAINTSGGGTGFFPGSIAGSVGSGTNTGFYA